MATTETFQISPEQAEAYEERFAPPCSHTGWTQCSMPPMCAPARTWSTSPVAPGSSPGTQQNAWGLPVTAPDWT